MRYIVSILFMFYLAVLVVPAHAQNICSEYYPQSELTLRLDKEAYSSCEINTMITDYTSFLDEQIRLFQSLRAAYVRKLGTDYAADEQSLHLAEFDSHLAILEQTKNSITAAIGQENKSTLHDEMKAARSSSRLLKRKVTTSHDILSQDEQQIYCKLDFYFRLTKELQHKTVGCMTAPVIPGTASE